MQAGSGVVTGVQQQAEEVRQQVSALQQEAGGLVQQVAPALASFQAAHPTYQPPPHQDQVQPLPMFFRVTCRSTNIMHCSCCVGLTHMCIGADGLYIAPVDAVNPVLFMQRKSVAGSLVLALISSAVFWQLVFRFRHVKHASWQSASSWSRDYPMWVM